MGDARGARIRGKTSGEMGDARGARFRGKTSKMGDARDARKYFETTGITHLGK